MRSKVNSQSIPSPMGSMPRLGVWAWSFVGLVLAAAIVLFALGAVSEIVLPMTFAVVLAILFKPLARFLERHKCKPGLAASLVVIGLLLGMTGVVTATVSSIVGQAQHISAVTSAALEKAAKQTSHLGIDQAALDTARTAVADAEPMVTTGILARLVSGIGTLVALASGIILGSLIMYYSLKDGAQLRRSFVNQFSARSRDQINGFIGDTCRILRDYGRGRTVMSVIVSLVIGLVALLLGLPLIFTIVVVNFVGGYIPYIGAFLGGGLAVIVALGEGGFVPASIMLAVVLASNLVLENFVEPKIMGRTLAIHPLVVLVVTALGGLVGGIVGLILAVPAYMVAGSAIRRWRSGPIVKPAP